MLLFGEVVPHARWREAGCRGWWPLASDPLGSVVSHMEVTCHFSQVPSIAFDNFQFHLPRFVLLIVLTGISQSVF